ncbi:hypothetical protein [Burkholderia reimsis]|uniref:hypothetical protein n=1 Tax=Burkholderia reimsis TaxID=2234132 RepID=UPI00140405BD|nr:hypothetical protein [Burkholderia reimsis]
MEVNMDRALSSRPRAGAFGARRAGSGIGMARFAFLPLPANFVAQGFAAPTTATARAQ